MYVVYWRCIIYYTDLIIHNGMDSLQNDFITSSPAVSACTVPCNIKQTHILPHSTLVRFLIFSVWISFISLNSLTDLLSSLMRILISVRDDLNCYTRCGFGFLAWKPGFLIGTVYLRCVVNEVMGLSLSTSSILISIQSQLLSEKTRAK